VDTLPGSDSSLSFVVSSQAGLAPGWRPSRFRSLTEEANMRVHQLLTAAGIVVVAGCAQTGGPAGSEQSVASAQCQYFVREERLVLSQVNKIEAQGAGYSVNMRLQDSLGRPFDATCIYAGGKTSWAQPLPANVSRRGDFK